MSSYVRLLVAAIATAGLAATGSTAAALATPAPGAPGTQEGFLPADKSGFETSATGDSKVWLTVQKEGGLGEMFYPDLGTPAARALQFVVADRRAGTATAAADAADVTTTQVDGRSLTYAQTFRARDGAWRLEATYVTDPAQNTVLVDVRFAARRSDAYDVYALYDPALSNTRDDDAGATTGGALVAGDASSASALIARPDFRATSNGFRGTSDGWADLLPDGRMDWHYDAAPAGNLVQTAQLDLGRAGHRGHGGGHGSGHTTIALGFGGDAGAALAAARASLEQGFGPTAGAYAGGWRDYLAGIKDAPRSLQGRGQRRLYRTSVMTLAASEDKTHRGAYVASPTMPWVWGKEAPSGPYHLVWSRDLYQIATGLIAAGDTGGANRALDFLFDTQQKPDGSFPQNSRVDGTPVWTGLQLDEVALPIVLAHQLGRTDAASWSHVQRAADFLIGFTQDGHQAPWTPQERWENQSGYSPATIASEIAGLVCAADIAKANGDTASADRYLATADAWQAKVKAWTATTTGPYSPDAYFLRLSKDGDPNAPTTYKIGDSGPSAADQRTVVDPSFLDLVRLGVLPADDATVRNSLNVVDQQLGVQTDQGFFWHRASFDGYGEKRNGDPWEFGLPDDSFLTLGRAWPLLNGERGEQQLAAGDGAGARTQLTAMANAAGPGGMLPEQVWDTRPPADGTGPLQPGTPTFSATPLAWTHAQYIRLAWDVAAGQVLEQPEVVAARYAG
ncbi:MAG: glucan 1,4-alpha-glucosidase [Conexibacter sp.]|jgi:glucoamylase|nr:glucan 1,4-alpha-glucosidase [Conexibacter sp.]